MSKIAVFMADKMEEVEGLTVVDLCRRANIETVMVSIMDSLVVEGSHGIKIVTDIALKELDFSTLDMLVLPGGLGGVKELEDCEDLMIHLDEFNAQKRPIAAICAAPTVFGHRGYVRGVEACCYPDMEDQLYDAKVSYNEVTVAGHITTSRGLGTAIPFALAIVERFCGKEAADALGKKVVYKQ